MLWLIQRQLKSKSVRVRCHAIQQLQRTGGEGALPLLLHSLQADPDPLVRTEAASALSQWKDARCLEALLAALQDTAPKVQVAALDSLRRCGDAGVVPQLAALLPEASPALRPPLAQTLHALGWQPKEPALEALYLVALGELDRAAILGKVAVGPLASVLKEGVYQKRVTAVHRLAEIGDPSAVPLLKEALHDQDSLVRAAAANALGKFGEPHSVPALAVLLKDRDPNVRAAGVSALGVLADPRIVEPLLHAAQDAHWEVRACVFEALGRMREPRALEPMLAGLQDPDREVRERAADGLGMLGDARALGALIQSAIEPEGTVRQAAARALARLNPSWHQTPEARLLVDTIRSAVRHRDHGVQLAAVEILRRMGEAPTSLPEPTRRSETDVQKRRPSARDHFLELLHDPQPDLRQAAIECLQRLREPTLAIALTTLTSDPDPAVRRAAHLALATEVSGSRPAPAAAPHAP